LDHNLSSQAQQAALLVAERLRDHDAVERMAMLQMTIPREYQSPEWSPSSLNCGVGIAVMYNYVEQCFPGRGWGTFAQRYLSIAATDTQKTPLARPALFGGTSGLVLALSLAVQGTVRYRKTLTSLYEAIQDQVRLWEAHDPDIDSGLAWGSFDVIIGAAGVLTTLVSVEQPDEVVNEAIAHLLAYLTWLTEPGQPAGKERWYVPPTLSPTDMLERYPQGHWNCGLAHGSPGALAALSLSWLAGYRYPGVAESIGYVAQWLLDHQVPDRQGSMSWPTCIGSESASSSQDWQVLPAARTAWCYGVPGVSRSLWLAGQALNDDRLRQAAVEAIEGVLRLPIRERGVPSPTLCHGVAGLLQTCLRFAHDTGSPAVKRQIPLLVEQILDAFDPELPFGFRDLDYGDQPGWLTGAAGVAVALLAASMPVSPAWDRILAIA
jgi:lantibiotic modifying enzyme